MKGIIALQIVGLTLLAISVQLGLCKEPNELWPLFDTNKSGDMDLNEFKAGVKAAQYTLTDAECDEVFVKYVQDGKAGKISKALFYFKLVPWLRWKKMDTNNDSRVSKDELKKGFTDLEATTTPALFDKMFSSLEVDGAGITYRDFFFKAHPFIRFCWVDADDNGKISKKEVQTGFDKHFHMTLDGKAVDFIFAIADKDQNEVDDDEFRNFVEPYLRFRVFDENNDGKITQDELKKGFKSYQVKITDANLQKLYTTADKDGNGICYKEYIDSIRPYLIFARFDRDGDGEATPEEFEVGYRILVGPAYPKQKISAVFDKAAGDNKKMCYTEFLTILKHFIG